MFPQETRKMKKKDSKKRKALTYEGSEDEYLEEGVKGNEFCKYHGMCRRRIDEYMILKAFIQEAKQKKSKHFYKKKKYTKQEINFERKNEAC